MAMNMDAVLRIAAKVTGAVDLNALQRSLGDVETAAKAAAKSFEGVAKSRIWQASAVGAGAFAVAMGASVKAAIDFESSMADVRKVVSGLDTPQALAEIKQEILDLSTQMPITAQGFAEIYAAAGQSGIARNELQKFATMVGETAIAFDMTAAEAGQSLAQMRAALGLTMKELDALTDSMNYVSNNTGATAAQLVEFTNRAGAMGKVAGLTGQQTAAIGAAMIEAGVNTEVAATSTINLIKALSAGSSMTDRQVSALERLGYSYRPVVVAQRDLTREAEIQSRARLDVARSEADQRLSIARNETEKMSREIDRRYRQIKQQLEDQWEDERDARDEAMARASRQASKAMQREQQREQQALDDRYDELLKREMDRFEGRTDALVEAEREAVRKRFRGARREEQQALEDRYEARRDELNRQQEQEMKAQRRADRDRQQAQIEALETQQEAERRVINERQEELEKSERLKIEAIEEAEKQKLEIVRQQQKAAEAAQEKQAEAAADAWKQSFAERLQKDGAGFIDEILGRIAALSKDQQISVLTDFAGGEARGLPVLIANLERYREIAAMSGDAAAAAGSKTQEYGVRAKTTANQLQLLANKQQALAIETGERALPAFSNMLGVLDGVLGRVMGFTDQFPGATNALILFGAAASALVLAAPGIVATITLLKGAALIIGGLNIGGLIAGWLPVIVGALAGIGKAIAAVGFTMVAAFQVAFAPVLAWLGGTLVPALLAFFSGPAGWTVLAVAAVVAMAIAFREPITDFLTWLPGVFQAGFTAAKDYAGEVWAQIVADFTKGWEDAKAGTTAFGEWLNNAFDAIGKGFNTYVADPIRNAWTAVTTFLPEAMDAARERVVNAWTSIVGVIRNVFGSVMQFIASGINSLVDSVNYVIRGYNSIPVAPDISQLGYVSVPQFAAGGFVTRPTLAMIGEGGEPEYVVPESKALAFANNIVAGRRGAQALEPAESPLMMQWRNAIAESRAAALNQALGAQFRRTTGRWAPDFTASIMQSSQLRQAAPAAPSPVESVPIVIRPQLTGPIMEFNGQRFVTYEDLERAMRATAEGVVGRMRTPQARIALGTR
jgi:hypothetical protein